MRRDALASSRVVRRAITAGAFWAIAKVLETPRVARVEEKVNRSLSRAANQTGKSLRRRAAVARKNKGLVVAAVAALALAAGLFGRAASK